MTVFQIPTWHSRKIVFTGCYRNSILTVRMCLRAKPRATIFPSGLTLRLRSRQLSTLICDGIRIDTVAAFVRNVSKAFISYSFATVAQLVEQGPLKPKVLGSNPSRRTNKKSLRGFFGK